MEKSVNYTLEKGFVASAYVRRFREAKPTAPFEREGATDKRSLWWLSEDKLTNHINRSIGKSFQSLDKVECRNDSMDPNNISVDCGINQSFESSNIFDAGLKVVERCNRLIQDYRGPARSEQQQQVDNSIEIKRKSCISPISSFRESSALAQNEFEHNDKEDSSLFISPFSSVQTEDFPIHMFDLSDKQLCGDQSSKKINQQLLGQSNLFFEENSESYGNADLRDHYYINTQRTSVQPDHHARIDESTIREFVGDPEVIRLWAQLLNIRACSASVHAELSHES